VARELDQVALAEELAEQARVRAGERASRALAPRNSSVVISGARSAKRCST
jgi:hypothetical protein